MRPIEPVGWSLAALALIAACGEKGTTVYVVVSAGGAGGGDAGGAGTSGLSATTGGASGAGGAATGGSSAGSGSCAPGLSQCAGACLDLETTAEHCGACDQACETAMACVSGACSCIDGYMLCDGVCVDTASDGANCGDCGAACGADLVCSQGSCEVGCGGGDTLCGQSCVDTETHVQHCGGCDQPCPAGRLCEGGTCGCPGGLMSCQNLCVDTEADSQHCGACGAPCTGGRICEDSSCVCPAGLTFCGNTCVDTSTDLNHCGACNTACDPMGSCAAGECQAPPACPGLFCEDFEGGFTPNAWEGDLGEGTLVTDADLSSTVLHSPTGGSILYMVGLAFTDQIVEARVKGVFGTNSPVGWRAGIMARNSGSGATRSSYTFLMDGSGYVALYRDPALQGIAGCSGSIYAALDPEIWHTLRLEVTGGNPVRLRTFLDGVLQHDCSTTTEPLLPSGGGGLFVNGANMTRARFDDFIVLAP